VYLEVIVSYKLTQADRLLDEQGLCQVDLDAAIERIEKEAKAALTAIRLAAFAEDDEERRDYLRVILDSFMAIVRQKEIARLAAGNIAVTQIELRRLHLVPAASRWAQSRSQVA
jgi:hypothetical protein